MKYVEIKPLLDEGGWYHLRMKSSFFYKCQLKELSKNTLTIVDKFNLTSIFDLDSIESISQWRDSNGKGGR